MLEKEKEDNLKKEEEKILEKSEISLWLNNYSDIFSDFDPRPYSERALSDDFLHEIKKASKDKPSGTIELRFLVPSKGRNSKTETMVKERLHKHFKKHNEMLGKEKKSIFKQGWAFVSFGVIFMFAAAYILFYYAQKNLLNEFLIVLLQPGGWFLFWEGLNLLIFEAKKINPELEFYDKMTKSKVEFLPY